MASNLACIGLAVDEHEQASLLDELTATAVLVGTRGRSEMRRWEDAASGARVVLGTRGRALRQFLPSLAAPSGARLGTVEALGDDVCAADVLDEEGLEASRALFEAEQRMLFEQRRSGGRAAMVAFGGEVVVHADEEGFEDSGASLLDPDADPSSDDALRVASTSFIPIGAFAPPGEAHAIAQMAGVVLSADRRVNGLTGQAFSVARVETAGFVADVCLAASEHPEVPRPGQVIAGDVFLVACLLDDPVEEERPPRRRRRWWSRR